MRAGSLSHPKIIALLNSQFVPVFVSNEEFREQGKASAEERKELARIQQEGYAKKLSVGTVHAYVLSSDGKTHDSRHVAEAWKPAVTLTMLENAVKTFRPKVGDALAKTVVLPKPATERGSLRLALTARYLQREGGKLVLIEPTGSANWSEFPGTEWIVYSPTQSRRWLPEGVVEVGTTWTLPRAVMEPLLLRFYPPTENNDLKKNRIVEQTLQGRVVSVRQGVALARLDGALKMNHWFYHQADGRYVETQLLGYLEFDVRQKQIRSFRLVTEGALYLGRGHKQEYGVVVRAE